jgi:hypothetical protein
MHTNDSVLRRQRQGHLEDGGGKRRKRLKENIFYYNDCVLNASYAAIKDRCVNYILEGAKREWGGKRKGVCTCRPQRADHCQVVRLSSPYRVNSSFCWLAGMNLSLRAIYFCLNEIAIRIKWPGHYTQTYTLAKRTNFPLNPGCLTLRSGRTLAQDLDWSVVKNNVLVMNH